MHDEILYNFNKYDIQLFCGHVTQTVKCDLITYFHKYIYKDLDFEELNNFYSDKLGWEIEGTKKNYYFRKGRYWNQIIVGITKDNYYKLIEKNKYWDEEL